MIFIISNLGEVNEFCTGGGSGGDPKSILCRDFGINIDAGNTGLGTLIGPSLLKREFIDDIESISDRRCLCLRPLRIT